MRKFWAVGEARAGDAPLRFATAVSRQNAPIRSIYIVMAVGCQT